MTNVEKMANTLANLIADALRKSSKGMKQDEIYSILLKLYRKDGYVPIIRIEDLKYSPRIIKQLKECDQCKLHDLLDWAKERGIDVNLNRPFDAVRLILDCLFELCLFGSMKRSELISTPIFTGKSGIRLTYNGMCDLLRGLSDFASTQHTKDFLFHLGVLARELYSSYTGKDAESIKEIIKADPNEAEAFRVYVTSKFFPTVKAFLSIIYLFKYRWVVTELISIGRRLSTLGIRAKKSVEPTYLGRITSELLDSMMGIYYDDTVLNAYDTIIQNYFLVFREFWEAIEKGYEIEYIEAHPSMIRFVNGVKSVLDTVSPQTRSHLERRGIIRLGEIKHDIKDYVLTLYYLNIEAKRAGYVLISNIDDYDIVELLTKNSLVRRGELYGRY